jgi:hypothetical protein
LKGKNYERILPRRGRNTKVETMTHTKPHSLSKWARENERLPVPLQNNRRANMPMRGRGPNPEHVIYECEGLSKERDRLKRTATRTNPWPISKGDLLRKHYKEFIKFINEIQFE